MDGADGVTTPRFTLQDPLEIPSYSRDSRGELATGSHNQRADHTQVA